MRWAPLVGVIAACAPSGPERTLDAYARALEAADGASAHALSDSATRSALDADALSRFLTKNSTEAERAAVALRGAQPVEQRVRLQTESGEIVELVRRQGDWRVAFAPFATGRLDTPEEALRTFFFAARGHLSLLRRTMPDEARARLDTDAELGRHLHAQQDRIADAQAALEPLRPGMACIRGDVATLPWGAGRAVRLVRQDGTWRVVDLE